MADYTAHVSSHTAGNIVSRVLYAIWNGLIYLGETSARARLLEQVSQISDAELEARGLTRHDLIHRAMTNGHYM